MTRLGRRARVALVLAALLLLLPWCCGRLVLWRLPQALAGAVGVDGRVEAGKTRGGYLQTLTDQRIRWPFGLVVTLNARVYHGPLPLDGLREGRPVIRPASLVGRVRVDAPALWRGLEADFSGALEWDGSVMLSFKGRDLHREASGDLAGVDLRGFEFGYASGTGGDPLKLGLSGDRFALFQGPRRFDLVGLSAHFQRHRTSIGPWDSLDLSAAALDYAFAGSGYGVTALVCHGQRTPRPARVDLSCGGQGPGRAPLAGRLHGDLPGAASLETLVAWMLARDPLKRLRLENQVVSQWTRRGGRVRVDDFVLPTALGSVEGRFDLALGAFDPKEGGAWGHLHGRLALRLPRTLAELWLRWDGADRQLAAKRLAALGALNLIALDEGRVILDLGLEDGQLQVGDKRLPVTLVARLLRRAGGDDKSSAYARKGIYSANPFGTLKILILSLVER